MNQMGPMLSQMLAGGDIGTGRLLGGAGPTAGGTHNSQAAAAAGPTASTSPSLSSSAPQQRVGAADAADAGADAAAGEGEQRSQEVEAAVEGVIRAELPEADAQRWLATLRTDGAALAAQVGERRPLSAAYTAGALHHPPSSSQRLF